MANDERIYNISIAPAVSDRMSDHFEFLARVSADAADRLLAELMEGIRSLERMPYRNPTYNRPYLTVGKYRYMISGKRYHIIYQIMNDTVFVDDIQDCRQDDDRLTISLEEEE